MRNWFYALSRGKQIVWSVLAVHALLVVVLMSESWLRRSHHRKAIAVHTVQWVEPQAPRAPVVVAAPTPVARAKPAAKPTPKAAPAAKKPVAEKPVVTKSHVKPQNPEQTALLNEIQQTLREIAKPATPVASKPQLAIPTLAATSVVQEAPPDNVHERLSAFLQEALQLPEFGEVKVELSVDARGKLTHFKILETKSEKNADFLKNRLPELQFPCFNESSTLTIVFRNA